MPRVVLAVVTASFAALAAPLASAQTTELYRVYGSGTGASEGFAVAHVGDLDGDGIADLLTGAIKDGGSGRATLRSGVDGSVIDDWTGSSGDALGAAVLGLSDVDGDGAPDVLVGATSAQDTNGRTTGAAHVYSGASGALVRTYFGTFPSERFGTALAELGDLDGDGVADHAVGAPGASHSSAGAGSLYVFSGASGTELFRLDGSGIGDEFGTAVTRTGDLDGDGQPDLAVGVPLRDVSGVANAGVVSVWSSATKSVLYRIQGTQIGLELGRALAGGEDLDGDGLGDFLVGLPRWNGTFNGQGTVLACSGKNGKVLWQRDGTGTDDGMGRAVALEDRDGDGAAELVVSAGTPGVGPFRVERLRHDGVVLYMRPDLAGGDLFGFALAVLADVSGDGAPDVAVGTPDGDQGGGTDDGVVYVLEGARLWLNADPKSAPIGITLATQIGDGVPGHVTMRFAVELNGAPIFLAIPPFALFDAIGLASFAEVIPPGLSGVTTTLRAYAVKANGKLGRSNDEAISFP